MNEVDVAWAVLVIIFLLRYVQSFKAPQRMIHSCGPRFACAVQWYSVSAWLFSFALARNFWNIWKYDYHMFGFLNPDQIAFRLQNIGKDPQAQFTDEDAKELLMQPWLHWCAVFAPLAGLLSFILVFLQVLSLIRQSQRVRANQDEGDMCPWWMRNLMATIVLVIANPMVFVVLSMKAMIRALSVVTGSAWSDAAKVAGKTWEDVLIGETSMLSADLEIAYVVQFVTVWSFASMCHGLMYEAEIARELPAEEHRQRFRSLLAAVQGLYAYVFIGLIHCALDFAVAVASSWHVPKWTETAHHLRDVLLAQISPVLLFVTVLCMINMGFIGSEKRLRRSWATLWESS